jgi:hypothetical protein
MCKHRKEKHIDMLRGGGGRAGGGREGVGRTGGRQRAKYSISLFAPPPRGEHFAFPPPPLLRISMDAVEVECSQQKTCLSA